MNTWISTGGLLPSNDSTVFVWWGKCPEVAWFAHNHFVIQGEILDAKQVWWWMPMPPPPPDEKEE